MGVSYLYCPCVDCNNLKMVSSVDAIMDHVLRRGFRSQYHVWVWHGEEGEYRGNADGTNNDVGIGNDDMHDNNQQICEDNECEDDVGIGNDVEDSDKMDEMMQDVEGEYRDRPDVFKSLSEAAKKPLYPGCKKYTKLSGMLTLFNIKSQHG